MEMITDVDSARKAISAYAKTVEAFYLDRSKCDISADDTNVASQQNAIFSLHAAKLKQGEQNYEQALAYLARNGDAVSAAIRFLGHYEGRAETLEGIELIAGSSVAHRVDQILSKVLVHQPVV